MAPLQIANPRERAIVRLADLVTTPLSWWPSRRPSSTVRRVLLLRLERIGDLLMTLEAIADLRLAWPQATIDLAVGSWNAELATMIPAVQQIHVADLPWLSRGERETSWLAIMREARGWKRHAYDLAVNFEPDIRTNALAWLSGAPRRLGYATGGGRAFLTERATYDPTQHVSTNARVLVARATGSSVSTSVTPGQRLDIPADVRQRAAARLEALPRPWIGLHASGGRESKQWHLDRFAAVGRTLVARTGGSIVLTGGPSDVPLVNDVRRQLGDVTCIVTAGRAPLSDAAALIAALDVFITSDTGPMHVAGAVGTPVVALFGPSEPARFGPRAEHERIVRVDLPCSPCGQVRLPPVRCRGHVPDCMDGIHVDVVVGHALDLIEQSRDRRRSRFA